MTIKISDNKIEIKLKDVEDKIKSNKNFTRTDIQNALDLIRGKDFTIEDKKNILRNMIKRTGIKKSDYITIAESVDSEEIEDKTYKLKDKTYKFLDDILSYRGVIEEY